MSAIKLEKFSFPVTAGSAAQVVTTEELDAIKKQAFEEGIREGAAAASEAFSTGRSDTLASIHEAVSDACFSREEAHQLALRSLRPLINRMLEALVPELAQRGLAAEISAVVERAAREVPDAQPTIHVAPDIAEDVARQFEDYTGISIVADETLEQGQARAEWDGGFDLINLGQTADNVRLAIETYFAELEQPVDYGVKHAN